MAPVDDGRLAVRIDARSTFSLWRPGWRDKLRAGVLQPNVQLACQLAIGMFAVALFSLIRVVTWPAACLSATLLCVMMVMTSPNSHVGTRLFAAAATVGPAWLGAVLAGVVATLGKLIGRGTPGYLAFMCLAGALLLAVLVVNRVTTMPPFLWALGMVSCLVFGLVLLNGYAVFPISAFWTNVVGGTLASAALTLGVTVAVTLLVAPSLASDEVSDTVASVVRGVGANLSCYATRLFLAPGAAPPGSQCAAQMLLASGEADQADLLVEVAQGLMDAPGIDDDTLLQQLRQRSQPQGAAPPPPSAGAQKTRSPKVVPLGAGTVAAKLVQPLAVLRPKLNIARMSLTFAAMEPGYLRPGPFSVASWSAVVEALSLLITRLSALDCVLEDGVYVNEAVWSPEFVEAFRVVYAQTAASLQRLSETLRDPHASDKEFCSTYVLFGQSWLAARATLRQGMLGQVETYWANVRAAKSDAPMRITATLQVRALFFTWTLTNGIIEAVEALERAAAIAVCAPADYTPPAAPGAGAPGAPGEKAKASAPPSALQRKLAWLMPLAMIASNLPLLHNLYAVLATQLPARLSTPQELLRGRAFQAGVKIWVVLTTMLVATLVAIHYDGYIAVLAPSFGYAAAALSVSERVEATASKVAMWMLGTALGGGLGLLVMAWAPLATNPYALMAILVAATFGVGLLGLTQARITITLSLMTLSALILCQFRGGCCATGSLSFFAARVISVFIGVCFAALVANLVLPWYTSAWALETMAGAYRAAADLMGGMFDRLYADGATALAQSASKHRLAALDGGGVDGGDAHGGGAAPAKPVPVPVAAAAAAAAAAASTAPPVAAARMGPITGKPMAPPPSGAPPPGATPHAGGPSGSGPPPPLQARVALPLVGVAASLAKDTVLWQRGLLSTPPVVLHVHRALLAVLDRLAAMQLALVKPTISGAFTGNMFKNLLLPMEEVCTRMYSDLVALVEAACNHALAPSPHSYKEVEAKVAALDSTRLQARAAYEVSRRKLHAVVHDADASDLPFLVSADDSVRVLGFIFAHIKALDGMTKVARTLLGPENQARNSRASWLK